MHISDNPWHTLTTDEAALRLETSLQAGLGADNAARRLAYFSQSIN